MQAVLTRGLEPGLFRLASWLLVDRPPEPADEADARALAALAVRQGLGAALAVVAQAWPAAARAHLEDAATAARVRTALQLERCAEARDRLAAAGFETLPLKGTALARRVYANPALRPMGDVDLLVRGDAQAAARVLTAAGYALRSADAQHALVLDSPDGLELELHRSLASPALFHPIAFEALLGRASRDADGRLAASGPDLLVQLAIHAAFQHGLVLRLGQWLDFRRLLESESVEPAEVLAAAREARAVGETWATLRVAGALVGAGFDRLLAALAPHVPAAVMRHLAGRLRRPAGLLVPADPPLTRARLALAEGRRGELLAATLWPAGWPLRRVPGRALSLLSRVLPRQR